MSENPANDKTLADARPNSSSAPMHVITPASLPAQEVPPSDVAKVALDTSKLAGSDTNTNPAPDEAPTIDETLQLPGAETPADPPIDRAAAASRAGRTHVFTWDPDSERQSSAPLQGAPRVAGYEILNELGRGGMGVVYRARHRGLNRIVALKMILAGDFASLEQLQRFRAEAEAVAKLQHPHIVQIYDVGEQDGLPFFSLEYVDGPSLQTAFAGKPQLETDAAQIVETLARAMQYAHERGIVHRDLKPANVLLTKQGAAKITDFGLVKRMEGEDSGSTRTGMIMGTPSYMAPEQGRSSKDVGPLADVYSLGSMLYAMLTGRPPFLAPTPLETLMALLHHEPVPPSQLQPRISRDIETICLKCLQKEPSRRYASALELADDLRRLLNSEPILARPVGHIERVWRWCQRRPLVAGLGALVAGLALVVLIGAPIAAARISVERDAAIGARDDAKIAQELAEIAQFQAEQNEQQAIAARRDADQNAQSAAEQRGLALEALGILVTKVQNQLRESPATQQLKQELLKTGLEGLRKVALSAQDSTAADALAGEAHQRMGDIFQNLAQYAEAREQYELSHTIRLELARAESENLAAQGSLALSFTKLGDISLLEGDKPRALLHFREALKLRVALAEAQPEQAPAQIDLATSYTKLGGVSEAEEARTYYEQALALRQALVARTTDATRANRERDVWITFNRLAELSLRMNDLHAAHDYYDRSLTQAASLAALLPDSNRATTDLALSLMNLGNVSRQLGGTDEAKSHFTEALKLFQPLASADPRNLDLQTNVMLLLARRGDHAEAAEKAEALRNLAPQAHRNLYNVACGYSLCAEAVANGRTAELLSPEEITTQRRYVDQAIKVLELAVDRGLKGANDIAADHDLDSIHSHPDYPRLLARLE